MNTTRIFSWLALLSGTVGLVAARNPVTKRDIAPGWPGVFTDIINYQRTLSVSEIAKDKNAYRQKANYLWLGGRLEDNDVTLARGDAYVKDHTAAALLENAEMIKLDGFTGWQWKDKKLVVMLGKDRILLVEARFEGNDLLAFAGKFPLKACAKALDNPPRD